MIVLLEVVCRMGQNIRDTSRGHLDIDVFEELADLGLAHVATVLQRHDQSSQIRAEVAILVAGGQRPSIEFLFRRRVEALPLTLGIFRFDFDVLNDHYFIVQSHGIGRQRGGVNGAFDRGVDGEVFE